MENIAEWIMTKKKSLSEKLYSCRNFCIEWDSKEQKYTFGDESVLYYYKGYEVPLSFKPLKRNKKLTEKTVKVTLSEAQKTILREHAEDAGMTEDESLEDLIQYLLEVHCENI